ncbi:MAG: peptide/nickel transport system permease protein [Frankiaceae bacterium]|jgi:peptide/nickel transport system permease protein|nr:peptide/nickel transport system permease protein [Frankiaceae bacterium]
MTAPELTRPELRQTGLAPPAAVVARAAKRPLRAAMAWKAMSRNRLAVAGGVVILLVIAISALAPLLAPHDPIVGESVNRLLPLGAPGHLLGTDGQGRDILSRLIWGGRYSLTVAIVPVLCAIPVSLFVGIAAGYFGGRIGNAVMRVLDVVFAFPLVLLAIAIAAVLGPGLRNMMFAIWITLIPYMTRVVYTSTVQETQKDYVEAAKAAGSSQLQVLRMQLLPNVLSPLVVYGTTLCGVMITTAAGLSFLGVGVTPPAPDWGVMTADGRDVLLEGHPSVATIPGLAILLVSVAFNLLGDGIRDALDPRKQTA